VLEDILKIEIVVGLTALKGENCSTAYVNPSLT